MNKANKKALVTGNVIVVGVDIAKKKHWARIYNPMGLDVVKPFSFQNTREGFYCLVSKIMGIASRYYGFQDKKLFPLDISLALSVPY